jgi:hypothetical protein
MENQVHLFRSAPNRSCTGGSPVWKPAGEAYHDVRKSCCQTRPPPVQNRIVRSVRANRKEDQGTATTRFAAARSATI